jgi:hypothetical protein
METELISILTFIVSVIVLLIAVLTLHEANKQSKQAREQTELLRRTLYGEIYETPPLKRVGFLKPMAKYEFKQDNRIRFNEDKKVEKDAYIYEEVTVPKNDKVPLSITWRTGEKQSLRHVQLGFELGYNRKPRIAKRLPGWAAEEIKPLQTSEFIDLDGYYHIEYPIPRKFGKEHAFIVEFEVETGDSGKYDFYIEVYSEEAKEAFKKTLKVIVE